MNESCKNTSDIVQKIMYSPNYPGNYNNKVFCKWNILIPKGRLLRFRLKDLDTEWDHDKLSVYRDDDEREDYNTRIHGKNISFVAEYKGLVTLEFDSDCIINYRGFLLGFSLVGKCKSVRSNNM